MRLRTAIYLLSCVGFVSFGAIACSSGDADPTPGTTPAAQNPNQTPGDGTGNTTPEAPLRARPVCATIETGPKFGEGCSGTGSGDALCEISDPKCGTESCAYDSRNAGSFSFYCTSKCTVVGAGAAAGEERCPSGYECVAPSDSCSSASTGTKGLCAQREGFGCDPKVKVETSGKFFEGSANGELYHLESTYSSTTSKTTATLKLKQGNSFKTVSTWDGDATIRAIVRNGDSLLLVTSGFEVLVKGGAAEPHKIEPSSSSSNSYGSAYGVSAKDGAFVSLNVTGGGDSFAALSRRGDDGAWTEVGPTRQRVQHITSLTKGFLAICQKTLCGSADGETFTPIANLPEGVSFEADKTTNSSPTFGAAGASTDDFHLTTNGKLYHQRKGEWVEEGPHANPPVGGTGTNTSRPDVLRSFSDGTVVFHTYVDKGNGLGGYATYVYADDCWSYSPSGNLDNTDLVKLDATKGNVFVYADSYDKQLCTVASH